MWPRWDDLVLSRPAETFRLPQEIKASVLASVAAQLGLWYPSSKPNRQPMTFDAVFSGQEDGWFPMLVAIEDEKNWTGFGSEVKKLLSVRCPLKVGITYTGDSPEGQAYRDKIACDIREDFEEISLIRKEDPRIEYLFLVGAESDDNEISCWYSLDFRADVGPQGRTFQPVESLGRHQKGAA